MKKVIEETYCDICKEKEDIEQIEYPVIFKTEQTEGRNCEPYLSIEKLDVCRKCLNKIYNWQRSSRI